VPGSADAAVALGGHLTGLNSYLAEQHSPVSSLTMAAPEGRSPDSGMGQGAEQETNQSGGQNGGQGGYSDPQSNHQTSTSANAVPVATAVSGQAGLPDAAVQPAKPAGTHISVMA
jgi:hypothetical protein